ncbi:MAG TPA: sigma-70 family RNA polymerase sigma factor [Acetobacteraceae bacterium]|nr:sigma-70 family RNA polymerase sigma factor [Acetobacteraceae bacterium]
MTETEGDIASEALLARCGAGDSGAFKLLYDRHAPRLYAIALRIARQPGAATDALQEGFLQIWQNARLFDPARGPAVAWMTALVRYRALDLQRRRGPETAALDDVPTEDATIMLQRIEASADGRALRQCMERLEPARQRLVVLAFVEGYSHAELAMRLATPLGTIKSSIRRALASLRECLQG